MNQSNNLIGVSTMSEKDNNKSNEKYNDEDEFSPAYAVALGYNKEKDNAPKVLAKGQDKIAQKIVEIAKNEGIEIHQDADLVEILKAVDIDAEIPVEAFAAVAEIISYIYKANGKA